MKASSNEIAAKLMGYGAGYRSMRRPINRRHAVSERESILNRFEVRISTGMSLDEAAYGLPVSLSTLKRWRYGQQVLKSDKMYSSHKNIDIDEALKTISNLGSIEKHRYMEALFKLICWMRWPGKPKDHPSAMSICIIAYIHQKYTGSDRKLIDLPTEYRDLIIRYLDIDVLRFAFSDDAGLIPSFTEWKLEDEVHTDLEWMALVAQFLLTYEPNSDRKRDRPSLGKAYFATQNNVFKYNWEISLITFRRYWHLMGASATFHYIDRFHSKIGLTLDPASKGFSESIDALIREPSEVRRFLARSRWAIERLSARLDRRALSTIEFPSFPKSLSPDPVNIPPFPSNVIEVISRYKSA